MAVSISSIDGIVRRSYDDLIKGYFGWERIDNKSLCLIKENWWFKTFNILLTAGVLLFFLNDYFLFIYWNRNQKIVYMIITWGEGYKEMKARLRFCLEFWSTSVSSAASKSLRWGKSNLTKSESKLGKLRHSITVIDIIKNYGGHCCKIQAPRPPLSMLSSCHLTTRQSSNLPLPWPFYDPYLS